MTIKTKCLIILILLAMVDMVIPLPIIGALLIYVLFWRPPWFKNIVVEIYGAKGEENAR
jgi:hypothetical protein